jgi:hypothetical protein
LAKKQEPGIALPGQLEGPDTHVSSDITVNPQPVQNSHPTGDKGSFPKYKYHASGQSIVIDNAEDEANLGEEWQDSPAAFAETEGQAE